MLALTLSSGGSPSTSNCYHKEVGGQIQDIRALNKTNRAIVLRDVIGKPLAALTTQIWVTAHMARKQ
jgi:hypothetical protein